MERERFIISSFLAQFLTVRGLSYEVNLIERKVKQYDGILFLMKTKSTYNTKVSEVKK